MERVELVEGLASLGLGMDVEELLGEKGLAEEEVVEWLAWCKGRSSTVRVVEGKVPQGILPHLTATMMDVKVGGRERRPDDALYNSSPELRDKVARGNTVLRLEDQATGRVTHDMIIFALKKFTGGMGDEDEEQPEDGQVWQRYFLTPMEEVTRVVAVTKENGEAAHLSARLINGNFYYICGSKNVHLMFRTVEEVERYTESRYSVARTVARAWLELAATLEPNQLSLLCNLLHTAKLTAVFEVLCPDYQHVVSLAHLSSPVLKLLTFTRQYGAPALTALPPDTSLLLASALGLPAAQHVLVPVSAADARMEEVRAGYGYEGEVLYFVDANDRTVGLVKKKTVWYVLCRAIREKVNGATTVYRKEGGMTRQKEKEFMEKVDKRMEQIKVWLGLGKEDTRHWQELGRYFMAWTIGQLRGNPGMLEELSARGNFPQQWDKFLRETGMSDKEVDHQVGGEVVETRREVVTVTGPREGGVVVRVSKEVMEVRPYIAICTVTSLDLFGRNFKKVQDMVKKNHQRVAKNINISYVNLHDMKKVETSMDFTLSTTMELDSQPTIPKLDTKETALTVDTSDVLVEVSSCTSLEAAEDTLDKVLRQIFHLGVTEGGVEDKSIAVERATVAMPDGTSRCHPKMFSLENK